MDRDLAADLRRLRGRARLTQEELAEQAGLSARTVSDIERGLRKTIYQGTAVRLAAALRLAGPARAEFLAVARGRGPDESGGNLPTAPSPLLGRERELEELLARLRDPAVHLVTLTGPGGIGKTRLAIEAASLTGGDFPDGVYVVPLASVGDSALLFSEVAAVIGVGALDRAPFDAVVEHLRRACALLVLDTLEHLIPAGERIAALIAACPGLTVLVTSREGLHLRAETEVPVPALQVPPRDEPRLDRFGATALFVDRARAVSPGLAVSPDGARVITEICARLEGVPLAIELAAARVKHLSLSALRDHLGRSLEVLTGGPRDLPRRQRTMRDTIAWSYDLLGERERSLLRALSVFAGGSSIDATQAVWPHADPLAVLSSLIDKNLLASPDATALEPRYRMLDVIREYAGEHRELAGETLTLGQAHARYFRGLAERTEAEMGRGGQYAWMDRVDADRDNIRGALRWAIDRGDGVTAQRIAGALWQYWRNRGDLTEGRSWLGEVLGVGTDPHTASRAKVLWGAAWLAYHAADYDEAQRLSVEFLAWTRRGSDPVATRNALTVRGMVAMAEGRFKEALIGFTECVRICRGLPASWLLATSLLNLAAALMYAGDPTAALPPLQEALELYEHLGDRLFVARSRVYLGLAAAIRGDVAVGRPAVVEALREFRHLRDAPGTAEALEALSALDAVDAPVLAAEEAGHAHGIREQVPMRPLPFDARFTAERLATAMARTGVREWEDAWKHGRDAGLDEVADLGENNRSPQRWAAGP